MPRLPYRVHTWAAVVLVTGAACAAAPEPNPSVPLVAGHRSGGSPSTATLGTRGGGDEDRPRRGPPPEHPVAPPADHGQCIRGRMCQLEGFCSLDESGQCIAATSDDCRPSDACLGGRCTARDGLCIAASDEDCRSSWACKGYGLCSHDGADACMATSNEDCRASTRCARIGECHLAAGACVTSP